MLGCLPAQAGLVSALNTFKRGDYTEAFPEFLALAKLGQPVAQLDVAYLYAAGVGINQSNVRAYGWARLAGQNGEAKGTKLAAKLRAVLTPANRRLAARIVAPYTPAALRSSLLPIFSEGCGTDGSTHCTSGTWGQTPHCQPLHVYRYVYPRGAAFLGVQARVLVHFTIMPDGTAHLPYVVLGLPEPGYRFYAAVLTSILRSKFAHLPPGAQPARCNLLFSFIERPFAGLAAYPRLERFLYKMRRRAHSGDPRAQAIYGTVLATVPQVGKRRARNFLKWLVKAAQAGVALAQYEVGESLLAGLGCAHDASKALRWIHLAAAQDEPHAQVALAMRLLRGMPTAADWAQARRRLQAAVARHDKTGAIYLSALLAAAPVPQIRDPARALRLERKAFRGVGFDPTGYEIRAAAYATAGRFKRAVRAERRAIAHARALGWSLAPLQARLQRYEAGKPWFGNLLDDTAAPQGHA
jgi:TPR repeat protein